MAVVLLCIFGCAPSPTGLYVVVASDFAAPGQIDALELRAEGPEMRGDVRSIAALEGPLRVLITPGDPSRPTALHLVARARLGGVEVARREVTTTWIPGPTRVLHLHLSAACRGATCPACEHGRCADEAIDYGSLPLFPDGDAGEAVAMDAGVDAPFDVPLDVPRDTPRDGRDAPGADTGGSVGAITCLPTPAPYEGMRCEAGSGPLECVGPYECDYDVCRVVEDTDALSAGVDHTCAYRTGGSSVICWGDDSGGRLGGRVIPNPTLGRTSVVRVPGIDDAISVGAGDDFTCAVRASGAVTCWGRGASAWAATECASGFVAVTLPDGEVARRVDAGDTGVCVATEDAVFCWDGSLPIPRRVPGVGEARRLSVGGAHGCALTGGELVCWGDNTEGQLGAGDLSAHPAAVRVTGMADAVEVAAGARHTCVLAGARASRVVRCWGADALGQLDGTSGGSHATAPIEWPAPGADEISAGGDHTCIRSDTHVRCWGACEEEECGSTPLSPIRENEAYTAVAAGRDHTCVLGTGAWCLGADDVGQTGHPPPGDMSPHRIEGFR